MDIFFIIIAKKEVHVKRKAPCHSEDFLHDKALFLEIAIYLH